MASSSTTPPSMEPPFVNSITDLRQLSAAIITFQRRYDDLQSHLDYIRTTIDSKLPPHLLITPPQSQSPIIIPPIKAQQPITPTPQSPNNLTTTPTSPKLEPQTTPSPDAVPKPPIPQTTPLKDSPKAIPSSNAPKQSQPPKPPPESDFDRLCNTLTGRGLRDYLMANLSNPKKIREEAPKALKNSPFAARIVWECFGRFYLQGTKAYTKEPVIANRRKVSVLALEIFLLMGCDHSQIENEIKKEAQAAAVAWRNRLKNEARLVSTAEIDAHGLLFLIGCFGIPAQFSNADISDLIYASNAFTISPVLRCSSVLVARIPGIIDSLVKDKMEIEAVNVDLTFKIGRSQLILKSFLRKENWRKQNGGEVIEAHRKHLDKLKSLIRCLKRHKIDTSKFIPECKIEEMISSLVKEIDDLVEKRRKEEKETAKRKADQIVSSTYSKAQKVNHSPVPGHMSHKQQNNSLHQGLPQTNGFPGYINSYSDLPSVLLGSGASTLPDNFASVAPGVGPSGVMPIGSYYGPHGGMPNYSSQLYERHDERFAGHPSAIAGYRPSPSVESFAGLPNHSSVVGFPGRSSGSDLYNFADSVIETELKHSSGGSRTGGTRHSSYY